MDKEIFEEEKKPQRTFQLWSEREVRPRDLEWVIKRGLAMKVGGYTGETLLTRRLVVPAGFLENEDISWRALEARLRYFNDDGNNIVPRSLP